MNKVEVISLDRQGKVFEKSIKKLTFKILKILNKNNVSVEIYLINGQKMRFLNKKFRGKPKATSVLSFQEPRNFIYPKSKFKRIGEIYLNAEVLGFRFQVSGLLIHGLLHLLGYNHQKKNDRIKMERAEQQLLRKFQIPSTK